MFKFLSKSLSVSIGLRYIRAKRRNSFISFISVISMVGIILGVAALIIILSVMNGFEREISKRLLGMESHLTLRYFDDDWRNVMKKAKAHKKVIGAAPYIQGQGLVSSSNVSKGVRIRGINPKFENEVSDVGKHIVHGKLGDLSKNRWSVILGYEVAQRLLGELETRRIVAGKSLYKVGIKPECANASIAKQKTEACITDNRHRVMLMIPQFSVTAGGVSPTYRRFTVVGIFRINMQAYDSNMVLLNIRDARKLFRKKKAVSAIQLRLKNIFDQKGIEAIKSEFIKTQLAFDVRTWMQNHSNIFSAIKTEKRMMFFVLLLIVLVAAINIVSTLVMVVTDKQADIAILRTLGATPAMIRKIFIVQGSVIGQIGATVGVGLGILVALNVDSIISTIEGWLGRELMDPSVYYITKLTADVRWEEVLIIYLSTLVISLLATLYPARSAANTQPAEALRYE